MQQEIINQAIKMFDNEPDKWNSFLDLVWQKDTIHF